MIDSGKRLVTFMDAGADFTAVPYIIDEFTASGRVGEQLYNI
jgi:hypothetical protein